MLVASMNRVLWIHHIREEISLPKLSVQRSCENLQLVKVSLNVLCVCA